MCGIAGFINSSLSKDVFLNALNTLSHRGPDSSGYYFDNIVGLGHRRLSILDLSDLGAQPYYFNNLVLVFNGELYNYAEVREILKKEGYTFVSNSDTEVLIKAFHKWGIKCIDKFIGMFAFAIYNTSSNELFLCRDRIGVKPLYYSASKGLIFGSELKFFKQTNQDFTINHSAVDEYFRFGYITNQNSIFKEINKLLPGHYLHYKNNSYSIHEYWNVKPKSISTSNEEVITQELHELLTSSINYRMVSDVPVGVFLSGGIDSSIVTAILQKKHKKINTFTIGFNNPKYNEAGYAKEIATLLGTNHYESILNEEKAKDLLINFYDIYDEPTSDSSGIPTTFVSRLAKANGVKVVLSADGGDELFCGYNHYNKTEDYFNKMHSLGNKTNKLEKHFISTLNKLGITDHLRIKNLRHKIHSYNDLLRSNDLIEFYQRRISNQAEAELESMLKITTGFKSSRFKMMNNKGPIDNMAYWDLLHFLPDDLLVKIDRATMNVGIEGREPLLDHRLVEYAMQLPIDLKVKNGTNKYILKKILSGYIDPTVFERPKKGFSIPIFQWFSGELNFLFEEHFTKEKLEATNLFNTAEVLNEYKWFKKYAKEGKEFNIEKMWRILSFMMWWEKWNK